MTPGEAAARLIDKHGGDVREAIRDTFRKIVYHETALAELRAALSILQQVQGPC